MPSVKAVVSVVGKDQKGVVARFATYLAERGVNILDLEQQVTSGRFLMDMLIDLADVNVALDELMIGLREQGEAIGMSVRVALANQRREKKIAVLVSKESHCLDEVLSRCAAGTMRGKVVCVLGNHEDLRGTAESAGAVFEWFASVNKDEHFGWLLERLRAHAVDVVVLARYMQVLPPAVVRAYRGQIVNIHPSLLPHFPGARPYQRAWEAGMRVAGCTAHYVTEQLDEGPIILQDVFHIDVGRDTAEDVKHKGQRLEGRVLADAVQMHLDEKLVVVDDKVVFRPGLSAFFEHDGV